MIRIEQTPDDVKLSFAFQVNAEISAIRLMTASIARIPNLNVDQSEGNLTSGVSFRPAGLQQMDGSITLGVDFEFQIADGDDLTRTLATIQCRFEADYHLLPDFNPSASQIAAFHSGNAVFNCWPYLREFIQNSTVRMGLPPATVPFLRLVPRIEPRVIDGSAAEVVGQLPEQPVAPKARMLGVSSKRSVRKSK